MRLRRLLTGGLLALGLVTGTLLAATAPAVNASVRPVMVQKSGSDRISW